MQQKEEAMDRFVLASLCRCGPWFCSCSLWLMCLLWFRYYVCILVFILNQSVSWYTHLGYMYILCFQIGAFHPMVH